ncbi:MAG: aldo/keto reductase [Hyphomicrobiaceae bacterium]|nr:aldo/keto reductase [Hyphomicrobiaceae bacterium]MCC0007637.1 aldo/keto reductase [Hyphomicrobiaceae bacterium]
MEMRRLGLTGPLVSSVSLGAMGISGTYGPSTEAETMRLFARAVELGVNHFDTGDIYGMGLSEELIGRFLKQSRARVIVATKAGIRFIPGTGERRVDNSPAYLRSALEKSLMRLGRDHVELFYLGRRDPDRPIEEIITTLADLKREGKIGAIGLSEVSPETLMSANRVHRIAAVQSEYSLWTRDVERRLLSTCAELHTAFVAFSPLGRGILTCTSPDPATFTNSDFRRSMPRFQEPAYSQNRAALAAYSALCERFGRSPTEVAIAWVLSAGRHVIAIPGTRTAEHLERNVAAARIALTEAERREITAIFPEGFPWGERFNSGQAVGVESSG